MSCKYPECNNKHYAKGYCKKHYLFLIRNNLEPTPENIALIRKERNKKISQSTKGIKKNKRKSKTTYTKERELGLIKELSRLMVELNMYENDIMNICENKTQDEIKVKIKKINENINFIMKEINKLKMHKGFPLKNIEVGNYKQTKL